MTKSELIEQIAMRQPELSAKDVETAVRIILDDMTDALATGGRVEIRGFGSFSLHYRKPRTGRNPKTGDLDNFELFYAVMRSMLISKLSRSHVHYGL